MPVTNSKGALKQRIKIQDYPIRVYPPTKSRKYHQIAYVDALDRRRVVSGGLTWADAEKVVDRIVQELDTGAHSANELFSSLAEAWFDPSRPRAKPWSIRHTDTMRHIIDKKLNPELGQISCANLKRAHIQEVVSSGVSLSDGQRIKRTLSAILRWGWAHDWLTTEPDRLLGDVYWQGNQSEDHILGDDIVPGSEEIPSHEAVAKLYHAFNNVSRARWWEGLPVLVAAYSGLRIGEMLELRASDVNTTRRRISVTHQAVELNGKMISTLPKGRKVRTTVYPKTTPKITADLGSLPLAELLKKRVDEVVQEDPDGLLFPSPRGKVWVGSHFRKRRFHPAGIEAGWKLSTNKNRKFIWQWHSLRHVFATYLLWDLNVPAAAVAAAAGHSDVTTTLRVYGSATSDALDLIGRMTDSDYNSV